MIHSFSRKQIAIGSFVLILLLIGGYALWQKEGKRFTDPYYGLTTHLEVQMDDTTRTLLKQRLATAQASLAAQKQGSDVDTQLYLVIAEHHKMLGDLVASRETYETYLAIMPNSYVAWNAYADVLELMKDLPKAEEAFKMSLSLLKTDEYYQDYVEFLQRHFPERRAEVKVLLDEAYANLKQTPWIMTTLGNWFFETGECDQGKAHYDVAITLSPDDSTALKRDQKEKLAVCEQPR